MYSTPLDSFGSRQKRYSIELLCAVIEALEETEISFRETPEKLENPYNVLEAFRSVGLLVSQFG